MPFRVSGVSSSEPLWLLHAVETAAAMQYPAGAPRGITEPLGRLRKAAEDMTYYGDLVASLLWHAGAEGIDQETKRRPTDGPLTAGTDGQEEDDGDAWKEGPA